MRHLSVCSGIEAASVAWHPLGFTPVAFSEIEAFPSAVLAERWPGVPNLGDMTKFHSWPDYAISLLVGGTPCQSFSVAGLRKGLADPRGSLALTFLAIAARYRPRWLLWENVPGVLSDKGNAFGCFLAGLAELGYGWAYRVLDAQHFGIPQRRRRVFVVGYLGDWRRAAQVLFERHSLQGHSAPRRETRKDVAPTISALTKGGGGLGTDFDLDGGLICPAVTSKWAKGSDGPAGDECQNLATHSLRGHSDYGLGYPMLRADGGDCQGGSECLVTTPLVPVAIQAGALRENPESGPDGVGVRTDGLAYTLEALAEVQAVAMNLRGREGGAMPELDDLASIRAASGGSSRSYVAASAVRRLTPRECERLQGFPDDYTLITVRGKPAADGPRYKALGNSMAVPVMRWIGSRIALVDSLTSQPNEEREK
jgi:DNA (cytosine-5)-methyltransferase 1